MLTAPASATEERGSAQPGGAWAATKAGEVFRRKIKPAADEAFDLHGHGEESGEDGRKAGGVAGLAGEQAGEMQLGQIGHGIAVAQVRRRQADQGAGVEAEPVFVGAVEADSRAYIGPGAIEQRYGAVMQQVDEVAQRPVAVVTLTV